MVTAPASTGNTNNSWIVVTRIDHANSGILKKVIPGAAHVENRRDEVDGAEDRRRAGQVYRQDQEIDGWAWMAGSRQGRIKRPPCARSVYAGLALDKD
jgi:hypothetical protein